MGRGDPDHLYPIAGAFKDRRAQGQTRRAEVDPEDRVLTPSIRAAILQPRGLDLTSAKIGNCQIADVFRLATD